MKKAVITTNGLSYSDFSDAEKANIKVWQEAFKKHEDENAKVAYQAQRRAEYPDLSEQVGALIKHFKDIESVHPELKAIVEHVNEVKRRYPKP